MMKIKNVAKGFTLLELLVVVLIIGILASIALPQYENAVEKSKASEALIILKDLRDKQALCFLEKGAVDYHCSQDGLFEYADFLEGETDPDCEDTFCGPATKDFVYSGDGWDIYASRLPYGTKYYLEVTGYPGSNNNITCTNESDTKNYCKIIGLE